MAGGLILSWNDERLTWNPANYSGVWTLNLPAPQIWSPNLALINSVSENINVKVDNGTVASVAYNGEVTLIVPRLFSATCSLDLKYFPFDFQNCSFMFVSLGIGISPNESVTFIMPSATVITEMMDTSGEFTFVGSNMTNGTAALKNFAVNIPAFIVTLHYVRNPNYYVANVAVPSTLLLCKSLLD